ncbi:MAG: metallophosphoesterase [Phycisphaerales bacterium]|nr:metallophosphoesterase [Phycisphaerales bacterium]
MRTLITLLLLLSLNQTLLAIDDVQKPVDTESFTFVAFGDRTGGPEIGIKVLEEAVEMTNWLDPDLVMTVGDLVEGKSTRSEWISQHDEFISIMNQLEMNWYPVAGNHDVYPAKRGGESNTGLYEQHFGPLIYSFDHKFAHFVVLFTDEQMDYHDPSNSQNMSQEQMDWLRDDLSNTNAKQIFVFLHHPRWTEEYKGCNWDQVHEIFAKDGRSTTIVGGHIHTLRDDGMRDNVHYLTLATTGGWPKRGFDHATIHHLTQFQVRKEQVSIVHIPVGSILPSDAYPGIEFDDIRALHKRDWFSGFGHFARDQFDIEIELTNITSKEMSYKVGIQHAHGWRVEPEYVEVTIPSGALETVTLELISEGGTTLNPVEVIVRAYYPHQSGENQPVSIHKEILLNDDSG